MKVAVTGATGVIGTAVVRALLDRGDEVAALSRSAAGARSKLGEEVDLHEWPDPKGSPAPAAAFADVEGVIHLLGEPVAQRWTDSAKQEIRDSRVLGTRNLIAGLREAGPRLAVLVSQSATGFYGPHGSEAVDESTPAGSDFLAGVVVAWEAEARAADELGLRLVLARTGVVLSESGGALETMLTPFKLGVGGPVAGGDQYVPWVHIDDVVGALLFALDTEAASGPVNVTGPQPATNRELSKSLGRALKRPAVIPVPGFAIKLLYGEMSTIVTTGVRAEPRRLMDLGYAFHYPALDGAVAASV
ncbi:MAG: uncharacterized protein QOC95_2774 [Thermoleophilaceae bacterium]|nr:uncharacterized protein [Thermoleophilaceae bacterium]